MKAGVILPVIGLVLLALLFAVLARFYPDLRRYMKMKTM